MGDRFLGGPEPVYDKVVSGYETFHSPHPFACEWGGELPEISIAYETWGRLNEARDNAILLHTGLSASSHARSHARNSNPGWWEDFIGPDCALDTGEYFVVCTNLLGGCYGSTGPTATNPRTDRPWGTDFPIVTVGDMVRAQMLLVDHLGIDVLHASVGASLGGMQSLAVAAMFPERVSRIVSISASAFAHPQAIALRFVQRQAVMLDPEWRGGRYYGRSFPYRGQRLAREIGTITYRSGPEWEERFARERLGPGEPRLEPDYQVEHYLVHQGEKFCLQYDANSYLYISKAMDLFDLTQDPGDGRLLDRVECPSLVIGVTSDMLFPVWQQRELAQDLEKNGCEVTYLELDAPYGHDTFLIEKERVGGAVRRHLASSTKGE